MFSLLTSDFTHCSGFSIIDSEQVNANGDAACSMAKYLQNLAGSWNILKFEIKLAWIIG